MSLSDSSFFSSHESFGGVCAKGLPSLAQTRDLNITRVDNIMFVFVECVLVARLPCAHRSFTIVCA
jgi:hypothetical protein